MIIANLLNILIMKQKIFLAVALLCLVAGNSSAQIKKLGSKINVEKAVQAGVDATKAITLSDADIAALCKEYMVWMDANNPIAPPESEYAQRLEKMVGHISEVEGMKVNFAVYEVIDVNAFATGDGSIRVCAGLMDVMTDDEVFAVIGHEIGHVVNTDVKDAMKKAYTRSAVKNAAGSVSESIAKLGDSEFGAIAEALAGAQYSQKQENEADDYAFKFCLQNEVDPYAMHNSLSRLVELFESDGANSSRVQQMFSTHPDSAKRAARMKSQADKHTAAN